MRSLMEPLVTWITGLVILLSICLVLARSAKAESPTGIVTASRLNIRSEAGTSGKKRGRLRYGQKVTILETGKGSAVSGESTWYRIEGPGKLIGWVSSVYIRLEKAAPEKAEQTATPVRSEQKATPAEAEQKATPAEAEQKATPAEAEQKAAKKKRSTVRSYSVSRSKPYRFRDDPLIANGGCLGVRGGSGSKFDAKLCANQLRNLHEEWGVQHVVSLACRGSVKRVASRATKGIALTHESTKLFNNPRAYSKNVKTFERLGKLVGKKKLYIHCRHGTHRAVVATMGAWIASGRVSSVKQALARAGGHLSVFRHRYAILLFKQVVRFAREKGLKVEPEYDAFITRYDFTAKKKK